MANPNSGDVLTYNGTQWINQLYVQSHFGIGASPTYWLHATEGNSAFFYEDDRFGAGKAYFGFITTKPQQWTFRSGYSSGRLDIRDDTAVPEYPRHRP